MFAAVKKDPVPYVLAHDRKNDPQTIWWLTPLGAEETSEFRRRWDAADKKSANVIQRSRETITTDREQLMRQLSRVENGAEAGDEFVGEALVEFVTTTVDWFCLQELLMACQSMSQLREGEKK